MFKNIFLIRVASVNLKKIKHPRHCFPPLPLKYAQAILEEDSDCRVRLFDGWIEQHSPQDLLNAILDWPADLIVMCIDTLASQAGIDMASLIKRHKDIFIIGVGQDVTARPGDYLALDHIFDIVIGGEFEQELPGLIRQLRGSQTKEVKDFYCHKRSKELITVSRLDDLPFLRWSEKELQSYELIYPLKLSRKITCGYVLSARGCPYGCIFCSPAVRKTYGKNLRFRSARKVVDEIEGLMKLGVNVISFEDDDFTISGEHVVSICREIKKRSLRINWMAHARIDEIDASLLKIMREAGCILLLFGIESGSARILNILKKSPKDIDWIARAKEVFGQAKDIGIGTCALFIVGSPTETRQDLEKSMDLARDLNPDMIKVHFFTVYPGSEAYDQFKNRIDKSNFSSMHHYLNPTINVTNMDLVELRKAQKRFYRRFFLNPGLIFSHIITYGGFHIFNWRVSYTLLKKLLGLLFLENKI